MSDEHEHQPVNSTARSMSLCIVCGETIVWSAVNYRWELFVSNPATETRETVEVALRDDDKGELLVDWKAINAEASRRKVTRMTDEDGNVLIPWSSHGLDMKGVQERSAVWRLRKFPDTSTSESCALKACEEAGEFARAVIGMMEARPGRGDPVLEAAQAMLVLASWVGCYAPDRNVFAVMLDEMDRLGA